MMIIITITMMIMVTMTTVTIRKTLILRIQLIRLMVKDIPTGHILTKYHLHHLAILLVILT